MFILPLLLVVGVGSQLFFFIGDSANDPPHFENPPCPNAEDIAPCTCTSTSEELLLHMQLTKQIRCEGITDEQQLYDIFHGSFPVKHYDKLYFDTYLFDNLSDDVFGDIKFKTVFTPNYGNGRLKSVGPETFMKMSSELEILSLDYSNFTNFPSETLNLYPKLIYLSLRESPLESFPIIQSESLKFLDVSHGMYETIPSGAFDGMPNLESLWISSYKPFSIERGVFLSLSKLKTIEIVMSEGFSHIPSFTFEMDSTSLEKIDLRHNGIRTIDIDAFKGIQAGTKIDLSGNYVVLPEATWRSNVILDDDF